MADTKQTKTIGEHYVAAELARRGWAPAMTRDGIARTDILAVKADDARRPMIEVQVKAARGPRFERISWPLGLKSQEPAKQEGEFFVLVAIPDDEALMPRCFVVPRDHIAAAAYMAHQDWLLDPLAKAGKRNATVARSRVSVPTFERYEGRWDLLEHGQSSAPVLLDGRFHALASDPRVGLPPAHPWHHSLPSWS
ncbi:hypothetical protein [Clavibacter zhangzhiyongii]|uniref:hypothetical protein n=1 Tax=Clavibacter zhangzhiyongii TaxID=2768071 RepID=UPI00195C30DF|nr:hypothetical protein [Clavibacter zhangzhiyongii]MBM7026489.1 hypothetical protein [Clavibacter zhangzhiyongii]